MMSIINKSNASRIAGLDIIRAIASVLIVLYHYTTRYPESFNSNITFSLSLPWGAFAVSTFFILSGFLSYKHFSGKQKWHQYLLGRAKRLYVGYLPCFLITTVVVALLLPSRSQPFLVILANFTMLQGLFGIGSVDGAYWTLFVEIVFYIQVAVLILVKQHKKIYYIQIIWLAVLFSCALLVKNGIVVGLAKTVIMMYLNVEYGHLFLIGIALADIVENGLNRKLSVVTLVASVAYDALWHSHIYTLIVLISIILIFITTLPKFRDNDYGILGGVFRFFAAISFPLYLLHQFIGYAIMQNLEAVGFVSEWIILIPFAIIVALATLVHYGIERPLSKRLLFGKQK